MDINAFLDITDSDTGTIQLHARAHYAIARASVIDLQLPKITPALLHTRIDLVLYNGSVVPYLLAAAGDTFFPDPGGSEEQWGINTLQWLTLYPDVQRNRWWGQLSALHNQSAPT